MHCLTITAHPRAIPCGTATPTARSTVTKAVTAANSAAAPVVTAVSTKTTALPKSPLLLPNACLSTEMHQYRVFWG